MIWLFRVDEVFGGNKPEVKEHFVFDTDDTNFDLFKYEIDMYFALANYYLVNESNDNEIYLLRFIGSHKNPVRQLISEDNEILNIIRDFYIKKHKTI
jgi:hypothetical protein